MKVAPVTVSYALGRGDVDAAVLPEEYIAQPKVRLGTDDSKTSEYEVNISAQVEFPLVAAIELVSRSNKDRPESRRAFVIKSHTLLKNDVCLTVIDLVTKRSANLYGELLDDLGTERTAASRAAICASTCRGRRLGSRWQLETWEHELAIGERLPTLPIWLNEETCRSLRIR